MPNERHYNELNLESVGINLPYNMQAEQSVLGAVLLKPETLTDLVEIIRPEMFYTRQNAQIYSEMLRLFTSDQTIDFVTLLDAVISDGVFPSADEAKVYLTGLAETVPSISNVKAYAQIVQEKYLVRQLMGVAKDILQDAGDEPDADLLLENAEQRIYEIRSGRDSSALTPLSSSMVETLTNLQKISGPDADKYKGIPTGFRLLDTVLTGLGRGDLIILAARPGMGKTSFALNIATRVAMQQKVPVAIFSLEMTKEQLTNRILSAEAGIDSQAFRTGALRAEDWEYLALATEKLHDAPIYMDDTSGITITEMKAKIRRVNQDPARPNVGLIVIDYLQLMTSGQRSENRVQEISSITRNLKIMAKEMNVPIIALSQLSRAVEKQGNNSSHRPQLSDLRDSGSIEQDADCVLFLYRDSYYASQNPDGAEVDADTAECIVAKNRHGETSTVPLGWDGAHPLYGCGLQTLMNYERSYRRCAASAPGKSCWTAKHLALAVSGAGPTAWPLCLMRPLAEEKGHRLTVCTVNHGLRGETADRDESLRPGGLRRLGLPLRVFHAAELEAGVEAPGGGTGRAACGMPALAGGWPTRIDAVATPILGVTRPRRCCSRLARAPASTARRASGPAAGLSATPALPDEGRHRGRLPRACGERWVTDETNDARRLRPQPSAPAHCPPLCGVNSAAERNLARFCEKAPRRTNTSPGSAGCAAGIGQATDAVACGGGGTHPAQRRPAVWMSEPLRQTDPLILDMASTALWSRCGTRRKNISVCWPTLWKRAAARCGSPTPSDSAPGRRALAEEADKNTHAGRAEKADCRNLISLPESGDYPLPGGEAAYPGGSACFEEKTGCS